MGAENCYARRLRRNYVLLLSACFNACSGFLTMNTGFQSLHVANGGEDRSFHFMEGSVPIRTSGLVR